MNAPTGPSGMNPLEGHFSQEEESVAPQRRKKRKKRRKPQAINVGLMTNEMWIALVERCTEARRKGWSIAYTARRLGLSPYRVRQALANPDFRPEQMDRSLLKDSSHALPDTAFKANKDSLGRKRRSGPGPNTPDHPRNANDTPEDAARRQAIIDLMAIIPTMSPSTAKYWLKTVADLI